ncbi:5920_t:CDS:2 [Entrophospora sp. SA101]|nr:5920_t:CDS:2 [Entrophospora sp. SA101]CAJ0827811.1 6649_t:CDS:2 [Entrophospora sp. SA101]
MSDASSPISSTHLSMLSSSNISSNDKHYYNYKDNNDPRILYYVHIIIICNDDIQMAYKLIISLRSRKANMISLLIKEDLRVAALKTIDNLASIVPGEWNVSDDFERLLNNVSSYSVIVISMLYHEFERQMTLFKSCVDSNVALFISWDSGMELEEHVKDKMCPRTRLHQTLIDYHNSNKKISKKTNNGYRSGIVNWIHFQVGIFDEVILNNDLSNITTAFNSPNQFIFLNVTVKDDFVNVIVEAIVSSNVEPNRNYVVGDFVSHTFLGHIYKVVNQPEIKEFEVTNQLRLSGIVSARPLPRILYPDCNAYDYKLLVEISFQHHTIIYQKLTGHRRLTLKDWFINLYENKEFNYL